METRVCGLLGNLIDTSVATIHVHGKSPEPLYHVLSTKQMSKDTVLDLMQLADDLRERPRHEVMNRRQGAMVATLFYEPSTRTRMSFEAAVLRLGGRVVSAENARENSSAKKGEALRDVFRVVGSYVDAIVVRHHEADEIALAAPYSPVPIINAGAGAGEHPTQALLDIYTIYREFGRVEDLNVAVMGDLKYGRTVHSLLRLFAKFSGVRVKLVSPPALSLPEELHQELVADGLHLESDVSFEEALANSDVIYQTRVQKERIQDGHEIQSTFDFQIRPEHLERIRPSARILHPLPRVDEIHPDVDKDFRAAYFRQVENGLYLRMALMDSVLGGVLG
jgi:aspartate carbamoyltransferase catalytic subunit